MYVIIVGAGPVGTGIAELALDDHHDVVIIEPDEHKAQAALQQYDLRVFNADISEAGILEEAGVHRADVLIAATEDDADNLMAVFLGQEYGVERLVSVVNDEAHQVLFERMGARLVVAPRMIVAQHLYGFLRYPEFEGIVPIVGGEHGFKLTIGEEAPLAGRTLLEARQENLLPEGLLVVSLQRGEDVLVPTGTTALQAGDRLTLLTQEPIADEALEAFTG